MTMGSSRGPSRKDRQGRTDFRLSPWKPGPVPPESICAFCHREIPDGQEVLGVSAVPLPDVDLDPYRGQIIEITLLATGMRVPVIVASKDSQAARDGKHLMFMVCSDACASRLKATLEREISRGDAAP